jgi:hypothetical protein
MTHRRRVHWSRRPPSVKAVTIRHTRWSSVGDIVGWPLDVGPVVTTGGVSDSRATGVQSPVLSFLSAGRWFHRAYEWPQSGPPDFEGKGLASGEPPLISDPRNQAVDPRRPADQNRLAAGVCASCPLGRPVSTQAAVARVTRMSSRAAVTSSSSTGSMVANRSAAPGTDRATSSSTRAPAIPAVLRVSSWAHTPP